MSQRAAGERVRWLSALLILAAILGTSAIVRLWPVDAAAVLVASRPIYLFEAPVLPRATLKPSAEPLPEQLPTVRSVRLQADPISSANHLRQRYGGQGAVHDVRMEHVAAEENASLTAAPPVPQESAAAAVPIDAPISAGPVHIDEPVAIAEVSAPEILPVVERAETGALAEPLPPVHASPRAFVELPAVAVTRAVTVAGRGIMTGLRATGAMFRAAF